MRPFTLAGRTRAGQAGCPRSLGRATDLRLLPRLQGCAPEGRAVTTSEASGAGRPSVRPRARHGQDPQQGRLPGRSRRRPLLRGWRRRGGGRARVRRRAPRRSPPHPVAALAGPAHRRAALRGAPRRLRRAGGGPLARRDGLLGPVGAPLRRGRPRDDRPRRLPPPVVGVGLVLLQARARPLADGRRHAGRGHQRRRAPDRRLHRVVRAAALRGHRSAGRCNTLHPRQPPARPPPGAARRGRAAHRAALRAALAAGGARPGLRRPAHRGDGLSRDRPLRSRSGRRGRRSRRLAARGLDARVLRLRRARHALEGDARVRHPGRGRARLLRRHR